ncbi:TlpA family protein disulfide reductase [Rhodobacteraceae bacterium HSP-20]|uniref:TlpA family protein disulfide reductase n=1 Tax=Paragemmobacter amnigenus TaxID=2852097 RepID=A0ABS6J7M3_9RHOB|nr:TlpA disulfide reductase family protein [Rhodobacter amnigenus]MBU9698849.1 TlpA family protein disulfide reductase [Rhodobacter amnigenus]MBV4390076.1 TlpA family protein disulfide reductase [Rhodobacter amnigenus]
MAVTVGGLALLVGNAPGRIALPDATLQDMAGRPVSLIAPDGPLVVNLWASWCPPCRRALPMMVEQAQLPGAPRFVFANQGETAVQVQAFLTRVGIGPDHIALDLTAGMMTAFDAAGLPLTLISDERGEMVSSHVGEISRAELLRQIAKISGVKR